MRMNAIPAGRNMQGETAVDPCTSPSRRKGCPRLSMTTRPRGSPACAPASRPGSFYSASSSKARSRETSRASPWLSPTKWSGAARLFIEHVAKLRPRVGRIGEAAALDGRGTDLRADGAGVGHGELAPLADEARPLRLARVHGHPDPCADGPAVGLASRQPHAGIACEDARIGAACHHGEPCRALPAGFADPGDRMDGELGLRPPASRSGGSG